MQNNLNYKQLAHISGWLYLFIILAAGFAQGYARTELFHVSSSGETAQAIVQHPLLYRLGFSADLLAFMADAALAVLLYVLLAPANKVVALLASSFRLIAHPAIGAVNLLNHYAPLHLQTMSRAHADSWTNFFLEMHNTGYLIAGAFFGTSLLLLSPLVCKSNLFPNWLSYLLMPAGLGYLLNSFGNFLLPEQTWFNVAVIIPAVIAELSLCFFLLFKDTLATQNSNP